MLEEKLARFVMRHRLAVLAAILLVTVVFAYQLRYLEMYSEFDDLLPPRHPYTAVHIKFREKFGGANVVTLALEVKEGDVFNTATVTKVQRITRAMDLLPGVDHYQVASITHRKIRKTYVNPGGWIMTRPLVNETDLPDAEEELKRLKNDAATSIAYETLVSPDFKATLVTANFHETRIDYWGIFEGIQKIIKEEQDANHKIYVAGRPMLIGWVYYYFPQNLYISLMTLAVMTGLLGSYFRRLQGVIVPLTSAGVSAVWGLGFLSWLRYNLDPLGLVVPLLVLARTISHSVQLVERYFEEHDRLGGVKEATTAALAHLLRPGVLGVVTDALGILFITISTIPLMTKLAYYSAFLSASSIVTVFIMAPIFLSYLPAPRTGYVVEKALTTRILSRVALLSVGKGRWATLAATAVLAVAAGISSRNLVIGDVEAGSPVLRPNSEYNVAERRINEKFLGSDQLFIIVEGEKQDAIKDPRVLKTIEEFQEYMELDPNAGGSKALPQVVRTVSRVLHNNDPKWHRLPPDAYTVAGLLFQYENSAPIPEALSEYVDTFAQDANITVYYKDHRGSTITRALERAEEFVRQNPLDGAKFRLAGGLIGIFAAVNEEVAYSQELSLILILSTVFVLVVWGYRSLLAGLFLVLVLWLATVFTAAYMALQGLGLGIETLPVATVGIGIGVDYGIYILDRMKSEYARSGNYGEAIRTAITTTGMAVSFTATTLIGGVIFWYFLSDIRFQVEMSLLLSMLMFLNMMGALILLPVLVSLAQPRFVRA